MVRRLPASPSSAQGCMEGCFAVLTSPVPPRAAANRPCPAPSPAATEAELLAALWVLESAESVWRSPATVCLNDYLKHLAVFSQEVSESLALLADGFVGTCRQRLCWLADGRQPKVPLPTRNSLACCPTPVELAAGSAGAH